MGAAHTIRLGVGLACAAGVLLAAPPASAQAGRVALDAVVAADAGAGSSIVRTPTAVVDVFGAVSLGRGFDIRARPVVFRRAFNGEWRTQIYELALRYERPGAIGVRVDAGQIVSPIGLSILENRPDAALVISQHSTLYLPVPRYEAGTPTTFLLAAAYPFGAQVTVSGARWDARAAVIDGSPVRGRPLIGDNKPPRLANLVVGVGVTPRVGLRLGATVAHGAFAAAREVRDGRRGDRDASVAQVEGEWSFGFTRLAGEWLWTTREAAIGDARVHGGWVEATQTLAPRWFVSARYDDQRTAWTDQIARVARTETYRRAEATVGYRLTADLTLRASYLTRKGYVVGFWDDQVLASVVFARRFK